MEKIGDIRPAAELSPEMIKAICDAISQAFYSWKLKEEDDDGNDKGTFETLGSS
jgi:hypothetical protein